MKEEILERNSIKIKDISQKDENVKLEDLYKEIILLSDEEFKHYIECYYYKTGLKLLTLNKIRENRENIRGN